MGKKIAVLGAGSWGIAIAGLLRANEHQVTLWEFNKADCDALLKNRIHHDKLPGVKIDEDVLITNIVNEAVAGSEYVVLAVPAQKVRDVCNALNSLISTKTCFVNLAKGVEMGTLLRMSEVIEANIEMADIDRIATLSGPSHAEEVAAGIPTSVVAASVNDKFVEDIQRIFSNKTFRVYRSIDLTGVELGGSLKNVIAIASGILQGMGLGDNTTGALITRGLAEITRMGVKLGADPETLAGLSGIGDLITTCISRHSRNRYVGDRIGRGEKLKDILNSMVMVAEGVDTCRSAYEMSRKYDVEMPITDEVYKVLFEDKSPKEAVVDLMTRPLKDEVWR